MYRTHMLLRPRYCFGNGSCLMFKNEFVFQTLKTTQAMGEAMKGLTKEMDRMMLPLLQKVMQEFERHN